MSDTLPSSSPLPQAQETPRYDLITNYRCGSAIEEMERSDDGEWVRWEAIQARLTALAAEQERTKAENERLKYIVQGQRELADEAAIGYERLKAEKEAAAADVTRLQAQLEESNEEWAIVGRMLKTGGMSDPSYLIGAIGASLGLSVEDVEALLPARVQRDETTP